MPLRLELYENDEADLNGDVRGTTTVAQHPIISEAFGAIVLGQPQEGVQKW